MTRTFTATESQPMLNDAAASARTPESLFSELDKEGIVLLPRLVSDEQLRGMQEAFESKLKRVRWNNLDGYQKTELHRHMIEDVLLLDQGFVDIALHPLVKGVLDRYLGANYELTEAKGWKSIPTNRDFHGWHGDAWYDQKDAKTIPREVKLAFYLSDVRSGAFNYIRGSHRKQHPRYVRNSEVADVPKSQIAEIAGRAGSGFLFDTSGIHRQGVPMLEARRAIFFNYHDPAVQLQQEDLDYYRYHPLLLNAAFLGNLTDTDKRILGFGNKRNFVPAFDRHTGTPFLYSLYSAIFNIELLSKDLRERIRARMRRTFGR